MPIISRRGFLAAVPAALTLSAASPRNPVGCRDAMLKPLGEPDCWAAAKRVQAEVMEVTVDDKFGIPILAHPQQPYSVATPEEIKRLAADLKTNGVKISAFCVASRFDTRPDFEVDFLTKLAAIAQQMNIRAMRIDVVANKVPMDEFMKTAIPSLKKLVAATESTKVRFGVENHGGTFNQPTLMMSMLDGVGSKRMGVTLDTGNLYWYGHPISKVYEIIEMLAPHAVHTHCKNIGYPADRRDVQRPIGWEYSKYEAPVDKGDLDFSRIVKILQKAKYDGDLCVENETLGRMPESERAAVIASEIAYLKKLRAS